MASLAYVSQNAYTPRAKASEGFNLSTVARAAVAEYFHKNERFPDSNAEAGINNSISSRFVSDISIRPDGIIEVSLGDTEPDGIIAGKTITLQAIPDEDKGEIYWTCEIEELAKRHVPAACRQLAPQP